MPRPSRHTHFYISPATTHTEEDSGVLSFRATLLEGFATRFSAHVLDPRGGKPQDITHEVEWVPGIVVGGGGEFVPEWKKQELHLRGIRKGHAALSATYKGSSINVAIEILESDMLLYAPDGFVYRVPTEVWTHARPAPPHNPNPTRVVRYRPEDLPSHIQSMLENEVALANVPGGATPPGPSQKNIAPSDNITCFLLNLNSIMLSYSPKKPRDPGLNTAVSGHSKPAANKTRKAAPRRKRG